MEPISLSRLGFGIALLKRLQVVLFACLFLAGVGYAQEVSVQLEANSSDDVSYLDQYGTWIDVQPYGTVWQPSVSPDWRPFTYGHWVPTDAGWAWVSYEPYGWMVYHYGNWDYQPEVGWFWIEGSEWSPARVQWMHYDGYTSWAPMPPPGREWQDPWHSEGFRFWVVIRSQDLDRDNIGHRRIGRPPVPRDTDRRDVFREPLAVHDFEKVTGRTVTPEPLRHDPAPVYMHPVQKAPPQNRPAEPRQVGNNPQATHPIGTQPPENQPAVTKPVQFHKMVLPNSEQARVKKYSPQVEKKVLKPKAKKPVAKAAKPEPKK